MVRPVKVPTLVRDEPMIAEFNAVPVKVSAAAVTVLVFPYEIDVPLIVVALVVPVPPFATANVPPNVTAPVVAKAGVNPVVPPANEETPVEDVKYVFVSRVKVPADVILTNDGETYVSEARDVREEDEG